MIAQQPSVQPDSRQLVAWRSLWVTLLQPTAPEGCSHPSGTNTAEDQREDRRPELSTEIEELTAANAG